MLRIREAFAAAAAALFMALLSATGGCGSSSSGFGNGANAATGDDDASTSGNGDAAPTFGSGTNDGGSTGACADGSLSCFVRSDCSTTLSGTVYDPAGANPLYNVVVFVPNDPRGTLPAISSGTNTCNTCDVSIGDYVTATTSDSKGHFTLTGVPATTHVPLVVQIGKWRREVFLPQVTACKDNAVPPAQSRLPKNKSEGNLPQMALLTGSADNLGCFLTGIGVDPKEYSAPHAGGRVDVYRGLAGQSVSFGGVSFGGGAPGLSNGQTAGDCTNTSCPLWSAKSSLEKYDIVLLSCEGAEYDDDDSSGAGNKTQANKQAMHDWLSEGGKVFATHYHYTWFKNDNRDTDFQNVAQWRGMSSAGQSPGPNYDLDTSFPKGQTFHDWLANVNALTGTQIALSDVAVSVTGVSKDAQRWIYESLKDKQGNETEYTKYLSFLTPIGGVKAGATDAGIEANGPQYCGKAVFSDLHAGGAPVGDVPAACGTANLSPQYKALEFLFFDLSACVSPGTGGPQDIPPPTK